MSSDNPIFRKGVYQDEKGREYFFDNAKFILIFFVVLAHAISPLRTGSPACGYLWNVLNTLHMPCLIFISGYFGKRYISEKGIKVQRPFTYAILYIAAQIAVALFEVCALDHNIKISLFDARSSLWFLQCLFWWYLLLPLLDRFEPSYVLVGSILLGLAIGYDQSAGNFLAFARMINHMPFFLAGYYCTKENIEKLFTLKSRLLAVLALAAGLLGVYYFGQYSIGRIITSNYSYWNIPLLTKNLPQWAWWTSRAGFYIAAALLCFGFLSFVPRSWNIFTRFGSRTLSVYILHRFLYLADLEYEWYAPFMSPGGRWAMAGIALAVTLLFSLWPFDIIFRALQSIKVTALLKKEPKPKALPEK